MDDGEFDVIAKVDLSELRAQCNHFVERELRAKERLCIDSQTGWYFGIVGLDVDMPGTSHAIVEDLAILERVVEPPGEIELASSLKDRHLFSAVARYSHSIRYQLRIHDMAESEQGSFDLAWWIISLIRVRTLAEFLVPVAADYSWSVIAGLDERKCSVTFVEDIPTATKLDADSPVQTADLDWVGANVPTFARLLEIPCFRLAVESLSTHQHQTSERMMAATLWAGIESLFGIQSELGFRLSTYIAVVIEPSGPRRRQAYQKIKKLYGTRSKAVHGAKLSSEQLRTHVLEVRTILSRILCKFIEEGQVFSEDRIEREIFGDFSPSSAARPV
ncbi:HEPN domain-containing protein [Massilia soli]|uniref:Apea-like HEPN domain-containing protein n=1 Tax=Massilia soli TaxID=2792854 RepID=A0ABS7SML3_9BURK|nr:HEPN domain-containing protein [Massilia soli]MBZ2206538.1 hypothetical protein [Massilia soli]